MSIDGAKTRGRGNKQPAVGRPNRKKGGSNQARKEGYERAEALKPGLPARIAATRLLGAVVDGKASLDGLLDRDSGNPHFLALSPSDRSLVRAMLVSALRNLMRLEATIDHLTEKPLPDGARSLRHLLAIAMTQILHLGVADHAAVDMAVTQAQVDPRNRRFASLVNALLRRLIRERDEVVAAIAAKTPPFPLWFTRRMVTAYDEAAVNAMTASMLTPAPIDVTVKSDPDYWAEKLGGIVLATGTIRLAAGGAPVPELAGFDEGQWWIQDAAASIPARLFGDLTGKRVADLCAAPGGKTAQLILQGGDVTAFDQSANRLKRLESNLARLDLTAEVIKSRAQDVNDPDGFDAVLLDAPCSSTGTVRRHPDIPWTKSHEDIAKLAGVQRRLLDHAAKLVRPGGKLVFSNCSLDPEEGEEMVSGFLADNLDWHIEPVLPEHWPGLEQAVTSRGELRTHPGMLTYADPGLSGLDGFYAVVLRPI